MALKLFKHNSEIYNKFVDLINEGKKDILIVQGTGTGKSYLFMNMIDDGGIFADKKILYILPKNIIEKNIKNYPEFNSAMKKNVTFVAYKSFCNDNNMHYYLKNYDVIIADEAHHLGAKKSGVNLKLMIDEVRKNTSKENPKYFIGLTATPDREDGQNVIDMFDETIYGLNVFEAIEQGLMPQIEYFNLKYSYKAKYKDIPVEGDIYKNKSKKLLRDIVLHNPKKKWIVYFSTIKEVEKSRDFISEVFPNHRAIYLYNKSEHKEDEIRNIDDNENVVIVSVNKMLEGVHLSNVGGVLLLRNVGSFTVLRQIIGRVLSINTKESPLFIDAAKVSERILKKLLENASFEDEVENDCQTSNNTSVSVGINNVHNTIVENSSNNVVHSEHNTEINVNVESGIDNKTKISTKKKIFYVPFDRKEAYDFLNQIVHTANHINKSTMFFGKEYENLLEVRKKYKIGATEIAAIMKEYNCTFELATKYAINCRESNGTMGIYQYRNVRANTITDILRFFADDEKALKKLIAVYYFYKKKNPCASMEELLDRALSSMKKKEKNKFYYDGILYDSLGSFAKKNNLDKIALKNYRYNHNYTTYETADHYSKFEYNGVMYDNLEHYCKTHNLSHHDVLNFMEKKHCTRIVAINVFGIRSILSMYPTVANYLRDNNSNDAG